MTIPVNDWRIEIVNIAASGSTFWFASHWPLSSLKANCTVGWRCQWMILQSKHYLASALLDIFGKRYQYCRRRSRNDSWSCFDTVIICRHRHSPALLETWNWTLEDRHLILSFVSARLQIYICKFTSGFKIIICEIKNRYLRFWWSHYFHWDRLIFDIDEKYKSVIILVLIWAGYCDGL